MKVSVVVPVFNPGRYLETCVRSIVAQTLPASEFEAVFVDDGSTDGSGAFLDALAGDRPNVQVVHIAASGAPGRPRNVGLDHARGEYVQFLDSDDELAPDALERLYAIASRNASDVVLGKFASASMPRRQDLFGHTRGRCTLVDTPGLLDGSLGPTKLFRRELLTRAAIRFPEGWRHMEDQYFTVHAFLRAATFSILGDAPCYFFNRREGGGNISLERIDPESHMAHVAEILDLVERETEPGEIRDRLVRRFYRAEMLARLSELTYLDESPEFQAALFAAISRLARTRIDPRLDDDLGLITRLRSSLVREGRQGSVVDLAERARNVELVATLRSARWAGAQLVIEFEAHLAHREDGPVVVVEGDGRHELDPMLTNGLASSPVEVIPAPTTARATAILREADSALEWHVPSQTSVDLIELESDPSTRRRQLSVRGSLALDPQHVGSAFRPLEPGTWSVSVRLSALGFERTAGLAPTPGNGRLPEPALLGTPAQLVVPALSETGSLRLVVGHATSSGERVGIELARALGTLRPRLQHEPPMLELVLPVATDGDATLVVSLEVAAPPERYLVPATIEPHRGLVVLRAALGSALAGLRPGRYPMAVTPDSGSWTWPAGYVVVDDGGMRAEGIEPISAIARARRTAVWFAERRVSQMRLVVRRARGLLGPAMRRLYAGLPAPLRGPAGRAYRRLAR